MKTILNQADDISRRRFVQGAASTFLGVGMLPATEALFSRSAFAAGENASTARQIASAKRVIYLYMSGGMTHLDTFDVKPGAETQGPTKAINTSADGVQISEYLPRLAKHMHHGAIVNSLSSKTGAHQQANYLMHTSYEMRGTIKHPGMGAWMLKFLGQDNQTLPANVVIGGASRHPGAGFFESRFGPVMIGDPTKGLQNVTTRVAKDDFSYRLGLSQKLGEKFREEYGRKDVRAYTSMYDDAVKLMESPDLNAFDIAKEPEAVRKEYGDDRFGQGCLLARRLVESDAEVIGIDKAQVDALFLRSRPERMGTAGRADGHRIEEGLCGYLIAPPGHGGGKDFGEAVGALGHFPDTLRTVVDGEHAGDDRQQNLGGADVAGRLFSADMLLAGLHGHAQRPVSLAVDGDTDDAAGHCALVIVTGGEEGRVRPAVAHWHTKPLGRSERNVGA